MTHLHTDKTLSDERWEQILKVFKQRVDKSFLDSLKTEDDILRECVKLCDRIYESRHADGELYLHQTYTDPRNPKNKGVKTIGKL